MSNERVQFNLTERFAAPLPEFYRRRIIFWKDEGREFEKDVDALNLEGVKIVKLTGTNNFAVKKLLLHDDFTGNYLIYNPFSYAFLQDVFITVLSAGLDEESTAVLSIIKKCGSIEAFWQLAYKYTGFIHEEDNPSGYFVYPVLLTALAQTMNSSVLKGLKRC